MTDLGPDVSITPSALSQLVVSAAERVPGARVRLPLPRRRVEVVLDDGRACVELDLVVRYGEVVPEVARRVQQEVTGALARMCEVDVDAVDVAVTEVER